IRVRDGSGRLNAYGTGFLISDRLLMTNHHVLRTFEEARASQAEFNYQMGREGRLESSVLFPLAPEDLFVTSPELDYTVVAIAPRSIDGSPLSDWGFTPLHAEEGKVVKGEYLNIIQHPNGEPKMLAVRENELIDVLDSHLHYHTDTAPGSSGSPVYNDSWEVVALHHSGVPRTDAEGNYLTRDGTVWRPEMGEHRIDWIANEGVRISRIVQHLKSTSLAGAARDLRDRLLEAAPAGPVAALAPRTAAPVVRDGQATWTIPLQVSVTIGGPSVPQSLPMTSPSPAPSREAPVPPAAVSVPPRDIERAVKAVRERLQGNDSVLKVRPGYRFRD